MASPEAERAYYTGLIKEHGFASVPFEITGADIDPLFQQFREFLNLCSEPNGQQFRDAIAEKPPEGCRTIGGDYFVTRRIRGEINPRALNQAPSTEDKDVGHIGPRSLVLAESRLRQRVPKIMRQFLNSCVELHEAAKTAVRPAYCALGLENVMFADNPLNDQHVVRLLRYLGTAGALKAGLHFDRSVGTLAAWESHPGLVGTQANNAQRSSLDIVTLDAAAERAFASPIRHRSGHAKLFLGAGYNRLPDSEYDKNGELPLLLHGVLNEQPDEERDAVVVFMHPLAHYPGYIVPGPDETGIDEVRSFILRRGAVQEDVA